MINKPRKVLLSVLIPTPVFHSACLMAACSALRDLLEPVPTTGCLRPLTSAVDSKFLIVRLAAHPHNRARWQRQMATLQIPS